MTFTAPMLQFETCDSIGERASTCLYSHAIQISDARNISLIELAVLFSLGP